MLNKTPSDVLKETSDHVRSEFREQNHILSFDEYLAVFFENPLKLSRNSAEYLLDTFRYFSAFAPNNTQNNHKNLHVFKRHRGQNKPPIVGQEEAHESIYRIVEQFVRQGKIDKLIFLHGPNGSSKSSTAEAIACALEDYSRSDDGPVYRFNWIFPNDKVGFEGLGESTFGKHIGFGDKASEKHGSMTTFAHLSDDEIMCKMASEMKENPIYLLPQNVRLAVFKNAFLKIKGRECAQEDMPHHFLEGSLSAKNKQIFDALFIAYKGDLQKVLRHVQVERFFFSSRYRVGVATVEPQVAIDAQDRQVTLERNIQNIPSVLQNIRIFEPHGELIDANRGFIEFSDLLKRPLEAFKYLLTTIEKMNINLTSGLVDLDLIMLASANEKHLDAFKNSPDWPSFKGRFELVRVPYLLSSVQEQKIYEEDVRIIARTKPIAPHTLSCLAKWAVLTRLRQPDAEVYDVSVRPLVVRLDPYEKLELYDNRALSENFSEAEQSVLKKISSEIYKESQGSIAYEGRFGASPREMKLLLYFAANNSKHDSVSPLAIFEEIDKLTRDKTVYDYLQFEPRGGYHDYREFLKYIKTMFAKIFQREFLAALNFYDEQQYSLALKKYLRHVTAFLKKEKIQNEMTGRMEDPSEDFMNELENLLDIGSTAKREFREKLVAKIASWRVENAEGELDITKIFSSELKTIANKIYQSKDQEIERVKQGMIMYGSEDYEKLPREVYQVCQETYKSLEMRFGYTPKTAWENIVFISSYKKML